MPATTAMATAGMVRRVLVVEDNELALKQLQQLLSLDPQLAVTTCSDGKQALRELAERPYSIVVTDLRLPGVDGMEIIRTVQAKRWPVTVIVTTGHGSIDEAVNAIRLGACDFLTKPIDLDRLQLVIQRALRERTLQDELAQLRASLNDRFAFHNILSKSPRMHAVFELISNLAQTGTTVLIEGETGTGKEQVARAIHAASAAVRSGPLVAINCAALPEALLESELFGHEKGAFTNAIGQRRGRFELAHGGTLFLDEVGDVPAAMQAKLLRVLQERRFERVGGVEPIEVDVRVVAATNRSLQRLVSKGTFREDLYYRLNVVKIELPPLRDRLEDVPLLATHFAHKYAREGEPAKRFAPEAMEALLAYRWPGNVRELENAIERACVTCRGPEILPENLPSELFAASAPAYGISVSLDKPLRQILADAVTSIEVQYIRKALKKSRGNVARAARLCGFSRRSITGKMQEYQISRKEFLSE